MDGQDLDTEDETNAGQSGASLEKLYENFL